MTHNLLYILLPPLFGALLNGCLAYKWRTNTPSNAAYITGSIATFLIFLSFIFVSLNFLELANTVSITGDIAFVHNFYKWFALDGFAIDLSFRFDHLSSVMCLVITGIGSLIHFYSMGYMSHDKGVARYFSI